MHSPCPGACTPLPSSELGAVFQPKCGGRLERAVVKSTLNQRPQERHFRPRVAIHLPATVSTTSLAPVQLQPPRNHPITGTATIYTPREERPCVVTLGSTGVPATLAVASQLPPRLGTAM